jgi:exodeoxyribonuclease V alpha subunit
VLTESHRFGEDSTIAALAAAVRTGDADGALHILAGDAPGVTWLRDTDQRGIDHLLDEVVAAALDVVRAATADDIEAGLTALRRVKVLAATRHRPFGLADWTDRIEARLQRAVPTVRTAGRWYVGRPVIVTANDHPNRLTNGDVGLTVRHGEAHAVAFEHAPEPRLVPPSQLDRIETWWAMTIHRSQGSEFPHAVVSLPPGSSPILSRELLYTAVTRARHQVTVVGGEEVIRAAIAQPVRRASGLRDRLWPGV